MLADGRRIVGRADRDEVKALVEAACRGAGVEPETCPAAVDDVFYGGGEQHRAAVAATHAFDDGHAAQTPGVAASPGITLAIAISRASTSKSRHMRIECVGGLKEHRCRADDLAADVFDGAEVRSL